MKSIVSSVTMYGRRRTPPILAPAAETLTNNRPPIKLNQPQRQTMISFKPQDLNDTPRRFPRTLAEAFPACPSWGQQEAPLSDKVLIYLCAFSTGFLVALVVFS